MDSIIFDDEYNGPRWTYGLVYRPLTRFAVPDGWIIGSNRDHSAYRHGTVDYPQQLPEHDLKAYELVEVKTPAYEG